MFFSTNPITFLAQSTTVHLPPSQPDPSIPVPKRQTAPAPADDDATTTTAPPPRCRTGTAVSLCRTAPCSAAMPRQSPSRVGVAALPDSRSPFQSFPGISGPVSTTPHDALIATQHAVSPPPIKTQAINSIFHPAVDEGEKLRPRPVTPRSATITRQRCQGGSSTSFSP